VTVWVTVLVLVEVLVLVDVLVLVVGSVVVGAVVVSVDGAVVAVVVVGALVSVTVAVLPPPVGDGTTDPDVDDVGDVVLAGLLESPPVSFTMATTISAISTAASAPRPTSAPGLRYQGVGGGPGSPGSGWPYPVGAPYSGWWGYSL